MQPENNTEESGKIIEIASDGDVVLVVGLKEARIQVSPRSTMGASKPFSAMFSPEYKELRIRSAKISPSTYISLETNLRH
jgi:hypothetical protein